MSSNLIRLCGGGRCPRVFLATDGGLVVQGRLVSDEVAHELNPLPDEAVVAISAEVAKELIAKLKQS